MRNKSIWFGCNSAQATAPFVDYIFLSTKKTPHFVIGMSSASVWNNTILQDLVSSFLISDQFAGNGDGDLGGGDGQQTSIYLATEGSTKEGIST